MVFAIHWHESAMGVHVFPILKPPSPHPIPQGHPSAPAPSTLSHALNLDWWFVSHMIIYTFQCYSLKPSHSRLEGVILEQGFLTLSRLMFGLNNSLLLGCSEHCRMFGSISGLYSLDAGSPPTSKSWQSKMSPHFTTCPWGVGNRERKGLQKSLSWKALLSNAETRQGMFQTTKKQNI